MSKRGILFIMTGASGVGKDTIRHAALPDIDGIFYSISATTRPRRPGETHDTETFESMIAHDELLEYAEYVGDYYGTPYQPVDAALAQGQDVLLELALVGAREAKRKLPEAGMLFIAPPNLSELERRLRGRGTDSEEKIQKRLTRAKEEIKAIREFDYLIVNDMLATAVREFRSIICAERAMTKYITEKDLSQYLRTH